MGLFLQTKLLLGMHFLLSSILKKYILLLILLFPLPAWPASLFELLGASCNLHTLLVDDSSSPYCYEQGACDRSPEKLRKMCVFRIPTLITQCENNQLTQALNTLHGAIGAMEDHVGLRIKYCREGQIDCLLIQERLGYISIEDMTSHFYFQDAKEYAWGVAANLNNVIVEPLGISILGELYNRDSLINVCEQ